MGQPHARGWLRGLKRMRNQQFLPRVGVGKAAARLSSFCPTIPFQKVMADNNERREGQQTPGGPGDAERHPKRVTQQDARAYDANSY